MLTEKQIKLAKDILIALPFNLKPLFEAEIKETGNTYACLGKWARQAFNTHHGERYERLQHDIQRFWLGIMESGITLRAPSVVHGGAVRDGVFRGIYRS